MAAGLALLLTAASISGTAAAATAAPKSEMTVSATAKADTVATGGNVAYTVRVECSNIVESSCDSPVVKMKTPVSKDGSVKASKPATNSTLVQLPIREEGDYTYFTLKAMKPGESVQFQVEWTIANYTTLPGLEIVTEAPELTFTTEGDESTVTGKVPTAVVTTTAPEVLATKAMVTPEKANQIMPNEPVTYRLTVCIPGNKLGMLNLKSVHVVDTFAFDADDIGNQDIIVNDAAGGTVDMAAHTITWDTPGEVPVCGQPGVWTRDVTITYPMSMVPEPDANAGLSSNAFSNKLEATAVAIDDSVTPLATAEVKHAFDKEIHNGGGGQITVFGSKGHVFERGSQVSTDVNTFTYWQLFGWWTTNKTADRQDRRAIVLGDHIPCVVPGGTEARSISVAKDLTAGNAFANNGDLSNYDFTGQDCTAPAWDVDSIYFRGLTNEGQVDYINVRYYDRATSTFGTKQYKMPTPAELKAAGSHIKVHPTAMPGYGGGSPYSLDLPETASITSLRMIVRDQLPNEPNLHERDTNRFSFYLWGNPTQEFADSTNYTMVNDITTALSERQDADGNVADAIADVPPWTTSRQAKYLEKSVAANIVKWSTGNRHEKPLGLGDTVEWCIRVGNDKGTNLPFKPVVHDILPVGLEYVEGSERYAETPENGAVPTMTTSKITVAGIERDKLTWTYPLDFAPGQEQVICFTTKVGMGATEGAHSLAQIKDGVTTLDAQYAATLNQYPEYPIVQGSVDRFDVDGDGNVTEALRETTQKWSVASQSGAKVEKWVRGSQDDQDEWIKDGVSAATTGQAGTRTDYRLTVQNTEGKELRDVVIYDVLPHEGDTAIGADLKGAPRESEFAVTFRQLGVLPAGVSVQYSTSYNPCRPELFPEEKGEQGACDDNWTDVAPSDPTTVKALKFTIDKMKTFEKKEIRFVGDVPAFVFKSTQKATEEANQVCLTSDGTLEGSRLAWNNVAFQADRIVNPGAEDTEPLLPAEAPKVSIREVCGQIGDRAWIDEDGDGVQDKDADGKYTEKGVPGVVFGLVDADGNDVLDDEGNPVTATTDADGNYSFFVPVGEWSVKVISVPADQDLVLTTPNAGDDNAVDSDATDIGVPTEKVAVTVDNLKNMTLDAGFRKGAVSVGDTVWIDANRDGIQDAGEEPIEGVVLTLQRKAADGTLHPVKDRDGKDVVSDTTDAEGKYLFENLPSLPAGESYVVFVDNKQDALKNYAPTIAGAGDDRAADSSTSEAASGDLTKNGESDLTLDFGFVKLVSIGDRLWLDNGSNPGVQESGEPGIAGVEVKLLDKDGKVVATTKTDADGYYSFTGLNPATEYTVQFPPTAKVDGKTYVLVPPAAGDDRKADSNPDATTGKAPVTTPETGDNSGEPNKADDPSIDAGYSQVLVSVGDYLWVDVNKDGKQDENERGVAGQKVTLKDAKGNVIATATTDADGYYFFKDLNPGESYSIVFPKTVTVDGVKYALTKPAQGADSAKDSNPAAATGEAKFVAPATGNNNTGRGETDDPTIDAGYVPAPVSIGDRLWLDLDGDGVQDKGEKGVPNATVTLLDADGKVVKTVKTDKNGNYVFTDLDPSTKYTVRFPTSVTVDGKTYGLTKPGRGTAATDSNPDAKTGLAPVTTPGSGNNSSTPSKADDPTIDAGYVLTESPKVSIGDYVWIDADSDGIQDEGEKGIPGVKVELRDKDGNVISTTKTDKNGYYRFDGLEPNTEYSLKFPTTVTVDGVEYPLTRPGQGNDGGKDSDPNSDGIVSVTTPGSGENLTFDAGFVPPTTVTPPTTPTPSTPPTTPTPTPTPPLVNTGFAGIAAAGIAGLLLAGGVALMAIRRRRA